jgi:hypothetical protein
METDPNPTPGEDAPPPSPEEIATALFSEALLTQARTAMMLLGKATHPAIGKPVVDTSRAKKLIEQLEVLEGKTTGLNAEETRLIRESLHSLRLSYVEVVGENPPATSPSETEPSKPATDNPAPNNEDDDHSPKRFVKKYD